MPAQSSNLLMNPMIAMASPDQQQSMLQLQQRQAIGQAMLQQGMQPMDTSNAQVGGLAYRVSPLQGAAKLLQTYLGNKMAMDSLGQEGQLMGQIYGNAFGSDQQAPVAQSAPPVAASADSGGLTGPAAGMGGMQGTPSPQALGATLQQNGVATPTQTVSTPGTYSLPGHTAAESRQLYMMNPEEYAKARMGFVTPTDATRMALAAHMDPVAANQAALLKANNLPFNTYAPNTVLQDPRNGQMSMTPSAAPEGAYTVLTPNGPQVVQEPGAQGVMQGNAAATAAGTAQSQLTEVYDPNANGGKGGMVRQTVSNVANAANGKQGGTALANGMPPTQDGTPSGPPMTPLQRSVMNTESFGNAGAVSPKGAVGSMQTMPATLQNPGFGVKPPQSNSPAELQRVGVDFLGAMQKRYGNDSDAVVAYNMGPGATDKWVAGGRQWNQLPPETQNYVGKTLAQAQNYQGAPAGGAAPSGAFAAAPPMGATSNANTAQQASADSMKASYANLQGVNSSANAALEALQKMQALGAKSTMASAGALGTTVAPIVSADAAEYEKQRANVITLLANQNGTNGSDAGRALTGESVPDYGKPKAAIQDGLQTQINQIRAQQLKANVLTPIYQSGDSKAYTTQENQFDQAVKPSMMPQLSTFLSMPPGPQRMQALQQAAKDPQMKAALDAISGAFK